LKILVIVSSLDLKYRLGCTPAWWQLFKALYETGNEVVAIPYLGEPVESLWWRTYPNPCTKESELYDSFLEKPGNRSRRDGLLSNVSSRIIKHYIRPKWEKYLFSILARESDFDAILFMNVPLNHLTGVPSKIKKEIDIPIVYYDGDMPTILPQYVEERGFKFNYYLNADLTEYDAFITNSKGVIPALKELGAQNVSTMYYGVDPDLYAPLDIEQDIDVFYYGHGSQAREKRMNFMITQPSNMLTEVNFVVGGKDFDLDLGMAKMQGFISFSAWRYFCCRSKINLNITRETHAKVYASSTSRPFELAALGCCVVSDPYNGLEEWFEVGKEMFMVHNTEEAVEIYHMLLSSEGLRRKTGELARQRVLREHTFKHRAVQLLNILQKRDGSSNGS
jgi:hypothetical protein